tara:strand:- start:62 stop:463 length:402 start_codon:yes stop_codon:yes gene_type:complete
MKTSHRFKILPLGVFTIIAFTFSVLSLAAPLSERRAFCLDRMTFFTKLPFYFHLNQKIYNECMENADALIAEDEQVSRDFLIEWEKDKIERDKMWEKENAERAARAAAQRKAEKLKNEQEIKKYEDLFSEFNE